jgi:hypothetical protein
LSAPIYAPHSEIGGLDGPNAIAEEASRLKITPKDKPLRDIFIPLSLQEFHACPHSVAGQPTHASEELALCTVFGVLAGDEHPAADMVSWRSRGFDELSNFGVDSEPNPLLAVPSSLKFLRKLTSQSCDQSRSICSLPKAENFSIQTDRQLCDFTKRRSRRHESGKMF